MTRKTQRTTPKLIALVALVLATGSPTLAQTPSRVDPLRSVAAALVKPNALLVIDLSASMQCDLQSAFWPAGQEKAFGSTDRRTCEFGGGKSRLPTGVRVGDFFAADGSVLDLPDQTLADDFFLADWTLEFRVPPLGFGNCSISGDFCAEDKNCGDGSCSGSGGSCGKDDECPGGETCLFPETCVILPPPPPPLCKGKDCLLCPAGTTPSTGDWRWRWHDASRLAVVKNLLGNSVALETLDEPMKSPKDLPTNWDDKIAKKPKRLAVRQRPPIGLIDANYDKINFGLGVFSCLNCHSNNLGNYWNETGFGSPNPTPGCQVENTDFDDGCKTFDAGTDPDFPTGENPAYKTMVPIDTDDINYAGQDFVRDAINAYFRPTTESTLLFQPDGSPVTIAGLETKTATPTACAINCARLEFKNQVFPSDPKLIECQRKNYVILLTDGQSSGKDCGGLTPGETADALFTSTRSLVSPGNPEGAVRTFVIGLSTQTTSGTARDELNQTAFNGRTDASDPIGGVEIPHDDPSWGVFDPTKNYAYFATNAQELASVLQRIIVSIATVDLASAPPVTTGTQTLAAFNGALVGLLASAEFPVSLGHLRLFNLDKVPTDPDFLKWNAGEGLTARDLTARPRQIYTSDPSSVPAHDLVPLVPGDANSIADLVTALAGTVTADEAATLLDFLHGLPVHEIPGDLTSPTHTRPWRLGDIVNSTPAIRGGPPKYVNFADHQAFQNALRLRQPLVFLGSNDLMLHTFDIVDGDEIWAYLPPNLLPKLLQQYQQWVADGYEFMGQPFRSVDHIYGVASSPRLIDIKDDSDNWLTALVSGQGPGGHALFALDVSASYPGRIIDGTNYPQDPNFDPLKPFRVLWFKTDQDAGFADLGESWSVPAAGFGTDTGGADTWMVAFGSAYGAADQGKFVHVLDAFSGNLISKGGAAALLDRAGQLVTDNFYFADTVGYSTVATSDDAPLNVEVQADLAGQLWTTKVDESSHAHTVLYDVGAAQPLYFAPAVSTFRAAGPFTIASYASGSFDETDRNVNGSSAALVAKLFISASTLDAASTATTTIDVTSLTKPDGTPFSSATRPVSSPLTVIPKAGNPRSLFTLFDPTPTGGDCFGRSYIAAVDFVPDPVGGPTIVTITTYGVGSGKVSGFAVGTDSIVVGETGTGGAAATITPVVDVNVVPVGSPLSVLQWRELF